VASGRRLITLVVALALVGAPAIVLRAFCIGESCADESPVATAVPFCPLPAVLRAQIEAGFRDGRSPDVMAATNGTDVVTDVDGVAVSWPSTSAASRDERVPIVFWGVGVDPGTLPEGTGLDQIAPTLASILRFDRPHPQVRAGVSVGDVASPGVIPRLVVMIAWEGVGTAGLRSAPAARSLIRKALDEGAGTLDGSTGSLPLDPVAALTTIGTGGLPSQHGITAASIRDERGEARSAWSAGAPLSIVSTLAEDFDRHFGERPLVGLTARDAADRGMVGGAWYPDHDRDEVRIGDDPVRSVRAMLSQGFGADDVPDILAVSLGGPVETMSRITSGIALAVERSDIPAAFVLAGTGQGSTTSPTTTIADDVDAAIGARVVTTVVPGGLFLDQEAMSANDVTSDDIVRVLDAMSAPDGTPLFADAFPGFAISFSRYC
jgi:hypothetical protein